MAFVNLPTFVARQILTAALLNQVVAALQGFAANTGDITWPLTMGDNLDADGQYTIVNMPTLWNIVNADEYDTLADAVTVVNDAGGGCLLLPPDTTVDGSTGVTITTSDFWVIGCGSSSVVELTSGAGPLFDTDANLSNVGFMNCTINEASATASADGVQFKQTTGARLINVRFTNFDGDAVFFTNDGTDGNSCIDAVVSGCEFNGGGSNGNHIKADDLDGLQMDMTISKGAGGDAIAMENTNANGILRDIQMGSGVRIESPTGKGISILGQSGTASANFSRVQLRGVHVVSPTDDGIEIGEASKIIRDVHIDGCVVEGPTIGADGFVLNAEDGIMIGCRAEGATNSGLDLVASQNVLVTGCNFKNGTVNGIDASGSGVTTTCTVRDCDVTTVATGVLTSGAATRVEVGGIIGSTVSKVMGRTIFKQMNTNFGLGGTGTAWTYTIPANTLTKAGDGIELSFSMAGAGTGAATCVMRVDGNTITVVTANDDEQGAAHGYVYLNGLPDAASNTDHWGLGNTAITLVDAGSAVNATIDFTADVDVTVQITSQGGSQNTTLRSAMFRVFEGIAD